MWCELQTKIFQELGFPWEPPFLKVLIFRVRRIETKELWGNSRTAMKENLPGLPFCWNVPSEPSVLYYDIIIVHTHWECPQQWLRCLS